MHPKIHQWASIVWRRLRNGSLLDPSVGAAIVCVHALERRRPATDEVVDAPSIANDFGWLIVQNVASALGSTLLGSRDLRAPAALGGVRRSLPQRFLAGLIGVMAFDFYLYVTHVARHKIPILWRFHTTHHSTEQLNQFSADRMHPVDNVVGVALTMVGARVFRTGGQSSGMARTLVGCLGRTHHANLHWHWRLLSRVLVSPAAHRLHHSVDAAHFDVNYGVTFSIWDRLFGTYLDPEGQGVPETGLPGYGIPQPATVKRVPAALVGQLLTPLRPQKPKRSEAAEASRKPGQKVA